MIWDYTQHKHRAIIKLMKQIDSFAFSNDMLVCVETDCLICVTLDEPKYLTISTGVNLKGIHAISYGDL